MNKTSPRKFSLISDGTKKFIQAARAQEDYTFWDFLHGYFYGRWTYFYIGMAKGEHPLVKNFNALLRFLRLKKTTTDSPSPPPPQPTYSRP